MCVASYIPVIDSISSKGMLHVQKTENDIRHFQKKEAVSKGLIESA
jgi:hypothetical protein